MDRRLPAVALALASLGLAPAASLGVLEATVRFPASGGVLSLEGDLLAPPALATLDPREGALRVALGPVVLLDGPAPAEGTRFRRLASGDWILRVRNAFEGRGSLTLRMSPGSGRFRLAARGFDATALRDAGPDGVLASVSIDGEAQEKPVDFTEKSPRRWTFTHVTPPRGGGGGGSGGGEDFPPPLGATIVAQGLDSGITTFRFEVVLDQAAWDALWLQHTGGGTGPSTPAPAVDFSTEMVIGVWLGNRPTGGYAARIEAVVPAQILGAPGAPAGVAVSIREDQPNPKAVVTQAVTRPFHIVRAPRALGGAMYELTVRVLP